MTIDDDTFDTPEKRRAWIESYTGLGGRNEKLEKLTALTRRSMKKEEVIAVAMTVLDEYPVEKDRVVWFGQYHFTFDENDRLMSGPNFESGDVKIECRFE